MTIQAHLSFQGQCKDAFEFYAKLFGGKIVFMQTWGESPLAKQVPAERLHEVLHATLRLDKQELLGADAGVNYARPQGFALVIEPFDATEAERWFAGLAAEGGTVEMPLQETFWAARYGVVRDRFGIPWEINCGK
jgi:PhnB protein